MKALILVFSELRQEMIDDYSREDSPRPTRRLNETMKTSERKFASTMVDDNQKADKELQTIASGKKLPVPAGLDADHAAMVRSLSDKSGNEFDSAYVTHMVADHDKAIDLFKSETSDTDQDLAAFARRTLPVL